MRKKLVAGNWKANGDKDFCRSLAAQVAARAGEVGGCDIALFPPFPYLFAAGDKSGSLGRVQLGAQSVSQYSNGAYTGEVSASMLADCGCSFVLVGHSERRALFSETDEMVAAKALMALQSGVLPVVCVGETLAERQRGETLAVVERQLTAVLQVVGSCWDKGGVLAYEPVWAIGTGMTASPEQAQEVHFALRACLERIQGGLVASKTRILYGGSVKSGNARALFSQPDIDGGLIGGASLIVDEFLAICREAN